MASITKGTYNISLHKLCTNDIFHSHVFGTIPKYREPYNDAGVRQGLYITFKWQMVPSISWMFFSIAVVWLVIIAWAGATSNWVTAIPVGQLILSSISLVFHYTKE
jgi:hypothetical protein